MLGQIIMYCVFIVIFCLCCTLIPFMAKLGLYLADRYIYLHKVKKFRKRNSELIKKYVQHDADVIMDAYRKYFNFKEEKNETQSND